MVKKRKTPIKVARSAKAAPSVFERIARISDFAKLALGSPAKLLTLASATTALVVTEKGLVVVDIAKKKVGKTIPIVDGDGDPHRITAIAITSDATHTILVENYSLRSVDLRTNTVGAEHRVSDYICGVACATDGTIALSSDRGDVLLYRLT